MVSGDIETNPGQINRLFSFCTSNLNSSSTHDFIRVSLLEAYNTVYSYDLIGIVETHLDWDADIDTLNLNGYYFSIVIILKTEREEALDFTSSNHFCVEGGLTLRSYQNA